VRVNNLVIQETHQQDSRAKGTHKGGGNMRATSACLFIPLTLFISLIATNQDAFADYASTVESAETAEMADADPMANVSVADAVHGAAEVMALAREFNAVMDEYGTETSGDRKKQLLERANNILKKLIALANSVEAEISTLARENLKQIYLRKLDRVLSSVVQARQVAQKRMQETRQTG
jgi:hypothetical protein